MGAISMKISTLIADLQDVLTYDGDLEVRFPDHTTVRGSCVAVDADDPQRPKVAFLLEDADLI